MPTMNYFHCPHLVKVVSTLLSLMKVVFCCCCRGLLDTGANVVTLRLWGSRAEPFVQSLHASFAVGALVARRAMWDGVVALIQGDRQLRTTRSGSLGLRDRG